MAAEGTTPVPQGAGCHQLKSALRVNGQCGMTCHPLVRIGCVEALATHEQFLPGDGDPEKVMDRLHAYCYFEALLAAVGRTSEERAGCCHRPAGVMLREISRDFERSDVCAQLLRVRLIAHHLSAVPLDERAACEEADRAASYQAESLIRASTVDSGSVRSGGGHFRL